MYKNILIISILSSLLLFSCSTAKKTTSNKGETKEMKTSHPIDGTWVFNVIPGKEYNEKDLFNEMPELTFEAKKGKFNGFGGCNKINGSIDIDGAKMKFKQPIASTRKACEKMGEKAFLDILPNINRYEVKGNTLHMYADKFEIMTLKRK